MIKICVIDGQGGGIGAAIIKRLKDVFEESVEIVALGTNAIATSQMLKAKANRGASGENAIFQTLFRLERTDLIIGPISIVIANSMMGEVTSRIAEAAASSRARKYLIPLFRENVEIVGLNAAPLPHLIEELIDKHLAAILPDRS